MPRYTLSSVEKLIQTKLPAKGMQFRWITPTQDDALYSVEIQITHFWNDLIEFSVVEKEFEEHRVCKYVIIQNTGKTRFFNVNKYIEFKQRPDFIFDDLCTFGEIIRYFSFPKFDQRSIGHEVFR